MACGKTIRRVGSGSASVLLATQCDHSGFPEARLISVYSRIMPLEKSRIVAETIPLAILICDHDGPPCALLKSSFEREKMVVAVRSAHTVETAKQILAEGQTNTIFIDPISLDLETASQFVFEVRTADPEIVFVLYVDRAKAELNRADFYRGERRRFSHYYSLDKGTPIAVFQDEVHAVLETCQSDLSWRMSTVSIGLFLEKIKRLPQAGDHVLEPNMYAQDLSDVVARLSQKLSPANSRLVPRSVFLSHRFAEVEYVDGLSELLEQNDFSIVTAKTANTYVSKAILDRIGSCEYFLCLMSRDQAKTDGTFTTSPWLLEEKGAALALGKPIVLMVEEGVTDFGGLQGDWQRIHFGPKGFLKAALQAVEQLKSYAGGGSSDAQTPPRVHSRGETSPS
jgi:hypothetical protein